MHESRQHMHPREIVAWFKHRIDGSPVHRIRILAELNDCEPDDIAELLDLYHVDIGIPKEEENIDLEYIRECISRGETFTSIGRRLGIKTDRLRLRAQRQGNSNALIRDIRKAQLDAITENRAEAVAMYENGATDQQVGETYGVPKQAARQWRTQNGVVSHYHRQHTCALTF